MPKADILFDKTEFVLRMADKQAMSMNVRAEQITSITIQPAMMKKLFKKVESEVMILNMKGGPGPMAGGLPLMKEAFESKEKGSWEKVKTQMLAFAKKNNITLHEESTVWEPPKMGEGM